MIDGRRHRAIDRMRAGAGVAAVVLALALFGSAPASGDSLSLKVARKIPEGGFMRGSMTGFASAPRVLFLYVTDKKPCAATATKENKRFTPKGSVRGGRLQRQVNGAFRNLGLDTGRPVRDPGYVCAYLTMVPSDQPGPVTTVGATTARASGRYRLKRCRHWFGKPFHSACRD